MNEELKEEQKQEALKRIEELTKMYNLNSSMLDHFMAESVCVVDFTDKERSQEVLGSYYKLIKNFEEEKNSLVYYCIICDIKYDNQKWETLNLFYVSPYKEEWESQRIPENDEVYVYSYNLSMQNYGEYGYIGVKVVDGELGRKY